MNASARPRITDDQRRARLMMRHRLIDGAHAGSPLDAADAMVGLHATTPSTVYLSTWARVPGFVPVDMDRALYDDRSLVRQLAMRRTMFVMPRPTLRDAVGAVGPRVAASERTNMLRDLRRSKEFPDPDGWIDAAAQAVAALLSDGTPRSTTQLRDEVPELAGKVTVGVGRSWGGTISMAPRLLSMMSAAGEIVRGPNAAAWHRSKPLWVAMQRWLGEPLDPPDVETGHAHMIGRWLRAFGPGTETDLVWWLGSTKTAVRTALTHLDVVEVDLADGSVGYVHADDVEQDGDVEPQAVLLPELDPTTMGHKQRGFYLREHGAHVFDSNGNGGQTAWWDGRIVGGWSRCDDGSVQIHPFERLPRAATKALSSRADELAAWLGDVTPRPAFPAPFMRGAPR
ncbi:winged helix DNA-binding domain-containing protein [Gordonia aichiensis]|uniref:Winged helix DNA-binding domain-containing protein n=1 Tax=Gordonia aichiensis NBRC 108223 TaxID=1220583 RepID=L7KIZ1_9ACTN|nr:winged helix DNA-binding domain-containing protein [Gordonia aichiensis]GAC47932.1 hypothetical protein GOACH_04_03290 [Gordonia aichiensis NBRC 108223]